MGCNKCYGKADNCTDCAIGYIVKNVITNATGKTTSCTNQCPTGTVNDTVNGAGCKCSSLCLTC